MPNKEQELLTDKLDRPDREKIARVLASMDNFPYDDLKEKDTSFNEGNPTQSHYIRRADQILALIPTEEEIRRAVTEEIRRELGKLILSDNIEAKSGTINYQEWQTFWEKYGVKEQEK